MNVNQTAKGRKANAIAFEAILAEAHNAARDAIKAQTSAYDFSDLRGACGFVYVVMEGRSPFVNYCRAIVKSNAGPSSRYGDKSWPSGWEFWSPGDYNGQRIDVKETGAFAFRAVLMAHNIRSAIRSRLD